MLFVFGPDCMVVTSHDKENLAIELKDELVIPVCLSIEMRIDHSILCIFCIRWCHSLRLRLLRALLHMPYRIFNVFVLIFALSLSHYSIPYANFPLALLNHTHMHAHAHKYTTLTQRQQREKHFLQQININKYDNNKNVFSLQDEFYCRCATPATYYYS